MIIDKYFYAIKILNIVMNIGFTTYGIIIIDKFLLEIPVFIYSLILAVVLNIICVIYQFIALFKFCKIYNVNFNLYCDFELWKYNQKFFLQQKIIFFFKSFFYLISAFISLAYLSIMNSEIKFFVILLFFHTIANITDIILSLNALNYVYINKGVPNQPLLMKNIILNEIDTCGICLIENNIGWCKLPCNHSFHFDCINPWISKGNSCPICRCYKYLLVVMVYPPISKILHISVFLHFLHFSQHVSQYCKPV